MTESKLIDRARPTAQPVFWRRWAAVVALLALSPVSAEYLIGYSDGVGRPLELLVGLIILAPLYGTVAVLIREAARGTLRGWPTILLLAAAFGVIQAGLVDQSLFFRDFAPDDPDWATQAPQTIIPGTGVDAASLLNYVGGHVIWSFAAPIALVEACAPRVATRRWLGPAGIVAMVALWIPAALLIHNDAADGSTASPAQLTSAAVAAAGLIAAAFLVRPKRTAHAGKAPSWWVVGVVAGIVLGANQLLPPNWAGTAVNVAALAVLGWLLVRWSRREGWGRRHVLASAGAALIVRAALSFLVEPLGEVDFIVKYAVNAAMLAGVIALLVLGARRIRRDEAAAC
jgi:hypothetical protein